VIVQVRVKSRPTWGRRASGASARLRAWSPQPTSELDAAPVSYSNDFAKTKLASPPQALRSSRPDHGVSTMRLCRAGRTKESKVHLTHATVTFACYRHHLMADRRRSVCPTAGDIPHLGGTATMPSRISNHRYRRVLAILFRSSSRARNPKRKSPGDGRRVKVEIPGRQGNSTLTRRPATYNQTWIRAYFSSATAPGNELIWDS
jgi:hypothetical protein